MAAVGQIAGLAAQVVKRRVAGINAHVVVQRGEDFAVVNRTITRVFAEAVRRADDLSSGMPPPAKMQFSAASPWAIRRFVDFRRAAEFALRDDGNIPVQSACGEIFDQCAQPDVEHRDGVTDIFEILVAPVPIKPAAVHVFQRPLAERQRDTPHSGLH